MHGHRVRRIPPSAPVKRRRRIPPFAPRTGKGGLGGIQTTKKRRTVPPSAPRTSPVRKPTQRRRKRR
jgi:hypothetical protein